MKNLRVNDNVKIGSYLHSNGNIDNNPSKDIIGICIIPSNFLPDGLARFVSIWESKSIWGRDINVNKNYKKKLPGKKLEELDWEFLNSPRLVSPYLPNGSFNPDFLVDLPQGNAFQDYKGYENTKKYKKKYGSSEELENSFSRCFRISPSYRKSKWYLPSIGELALLFKYKYLIDLAIEVGSTTNSPEVVFSYDGYWSSTEYDPEHAWGIDMYDGSVINDSKDVSYYVCPFLAL